MTVASASRVVRTPARVRAVTTRTTCRCDTATLQARRSRVGWTRTAPEPCVLLTAVHDAPPPSLTPSASPYQRGCRVVPRYAPEQLKRPDSATLAEEAFADDRRRQRQREIAAANGGKRLTRNHSAPLVRPELVDEVGPVVGAGEGASAGGDPETVRARVGCGCAGCDPGTTTSLCRGLRAAYRTRGTHPSRLMPPPTHPLDNCVNIGTGAAASEA